MPRIDFDASQFEPLSGRDAIPAGRYLAIITASELKPTRTGTGHYLELEHEILDGEHKGRKVWSRHNLRNPSTAAVEIANREMTSICRAIGVQQVGDTAELHQKPLMITVAVRTRQDTNEPVNEITGWAKKEVAAGVPQQAGVTGGPATPPWLRKG
jgi:hypothetical protein